MAETAQKIIREAASILHREELKGRGFRKSGFNWFREQNAWSHHLCFSLNKWNTVDEAKLKVDVGIFIPEFHLARCSPKFSGTPKVYMCAVQNNVAHDPHNPGSHSWVVTPTTCSSELAQSLATRLQAEAWTWFEQLRDYHDVARWLESQNKLFDAAIALALAGQLDDAGSLLARRLPQLHPTALPFVKKTAKRLQIPWPSSYDA